jgi:hypothetical protein
MFESCVSVRCTSVLAAAAALSFAFAGEAAAGSCCPTCGCAAVVVETDVTPVDPIYVVNRGPAFSGPGHYLSGIGPFVRDVPMPMPRPDYPWVGYLYTGYPYGGQDSGGYPRGSYSPFIGYPYGDPPPKVVYRTHGARHYPRYSR